MPDRSHRPQYDPALCGTCAICRGACPAAAFPELRGEGDTLRGKLGGGPAPADWPACRRACPLGQDVPGYLKALAAGDQAQALAIILRHNPLPSVLGHVCHHPCQEACASAPAQEPPRIRGLKAFAALAPRPALEISGQAAGLAVMVVGSGPAGLAAAWALARAGAAVTIREAEAVPGGLLAWGIPDFRLPRAALARDIEHVLSLGVKLEMSAPVTAAEVLAWRERGMPVVLACGAPQAPAGDLPGSDLPGVWQGLDLLRCLALGPQPELAGPAVVIGGGNAALDAARQLLRRGLAVTLAYRRDEAQMPAYAEEIAVARAEGLDLLFRRQPLELLPGADGRLERVALGATVPGASGTDGRTAFALIPDATPEELPARLCVLALGQRSGGPDWASALGLDAFNPDPSGRLAPGLYAAGDLAFGAATVVQAVAGGLACAAAIIEDRQP